MNCGLTMEAQTEGCSTCGIKGIHACLGKKPEPVGYVYSEAWTPIKKAAINGDIPNGTPLYTAPPQRNEPEPVAWMNEGDIGKTDWKVWAHGKPTATIPLYAAPKEKNT